MPSMLSSAAPILSSVTIVGFRFNPLRIARTVGGVKPAAFAMALLLCRCIRALMCASEPSKVCVVVICSSSFVVNKVNIEDIFSIVK